LRRAQIRQHEMKKRRARRGLATLCISGGMGLALLVERA
jgi:acetyl-CoA C-acetyltransferase